MVGVHTSVVPVTLVLLGVLCLNGCDGSDDAATEPSVASSPSSPSSTPTSQPSATAADPPSRSDTAQTCADLYYPPAQLIPRAIELVHGSAAGDPVAEAKEIAAGLSTVAGTADPGLAADVAIVRVGVDTRRALAQSGVDHDPDLRSFDAAAHRLDTACATYGE
jgi:hypothetical protein